MGSAAIDSATDRLPLDYGRTLEITADENGQQMRILAPGGEAELRVVLTPEGPVVRLQAVRLEVTAEELLKFSSKNVQIEAQESLDLQTEGVLHMEGDTVDVEASDDVRIDGRFIRLNSPDMPRDFVDPVFTRLEGAEQLSDEDVERLGGGPHATSCCQG